MDTHPRDFNAQQIRNIARDLEGTALGDSFFGEALAQARVLPCVTEEDKALLSRYLQGTNAGTDHVALQDLARRIYALAAQDSRATTTDH